MRVLAFSLLVLLGACGLPEKPNAFAVPDPAPLDSLQAPVGSALLHGILP